LDSKYIFTELSAKNFTSLTQGGTRYKTTTVLSSTSTQSGVAAGRKRCFDSPLFTRGFATPSRWPPQSAWRGSGPIHTL